MQLRFALVYAFASGLDKSELDLDGSGRVLDFRPDSGFERLKLIGDAVLGKLSQCASLSWSHSHTPSRLGLDSPLGSTIACIREDGVLVSGEKFFNMGEVVHIGTRRLKAVHNPRLYIHPNMRLHTEVAVAALFGLMHREAQRASCILGRAQCLNDRGIHNRAFGESRPLAQKVVVDQGKGSLSELVGFKQVPKV